MKFKEIVVSHFSLFNRMNEQKRNEQVDAVKYMLMIASTSGINIQDWDCQAVFGTGKSPNEIVTSRQDINKRLFEREEQLRELNKTEGVSGELSEIVRNSINQLSTRAMADQIARADESARSYRRQAMDYYRNFESYLKTSASYSASVAHLKGQDFSMDKQVETVNKGDFWRFDEARDNGSIRFVTKNDIICSLKNPAAGIDITINFGKFIADFNISNACLEVYPYENNRNVDGIYHPHINNGRVCWGNAADVASKAITGLNIVQTMTLLSSVLVCYTPGHPYVSIETFYEKSLTEEERLKEKQKRELAMKIARGEVQREVEGEYLAVGVSVTTNAGFIDGVDVNSVTRSEL